MSFRLPTSQSLLRTANATRTALPRVRVAPACRQIHHHYPHLSGPTVISAASVANRASRAFSSSRRALGSGQSDGELSAKLAQEIEYERESTQQAAQQASADDSVAAQEPDFLRDFKAQSTWRIQDQPGSDEIALVRTFGNEHIRVLFSIGDIDTSSQAADDVFNSAKGEGAGGGASGQPDGEDAEDTMGFPVRCSISITKPSHGALVIDAQAIDGEFDIENISFYRDDKLATDLTAEADWARRGLYIGPQFETLDDQVQAQFESFLEERGINTDLALFVPSFAEWKEQKEYCKWLENVKTFIDA